MFNKSEELFRLIIVYLVGYFRLTSAFLDSPRPFLHNFPQASQLLLLLQLSIESANVDPTFVETRESGFR